MDYRRAILAALLTYAITFILGITSALLGFGFEGDSNTISTYTWVIGGVLAIVATAFGAWWYFRKKGIRTNVNTGFHLGLVIIVVSFILDWIAFLPSISDPETMELVNAYYGNPAFWAIVTVVLATASLTGKYYDRFFAKSSKKSK